MKTTNTALEATRRRVIELENAIESKQKRFEASHYYHNLIGAMAGIGALLLLQLLGIALNPIAAEIMDAAQAAEMIEDTRLQAFDPKFAPKPVKQGKSATLKCTGKNC